MSGKQKAVIWIGLILIILNWVANWSAIKGVIFSSGSQSGSKTPSPPKQGFNWSWPLNDPGRVFGVNTTPTPPPNQTQVV